MSANRLLRSVLVLITTTLFLGGRSDSILGVANPDQGVDTASYHLGLKINVIDTKFCAGDGELSIMQLKLRLHYFNSGKHPIILYKGSNVAPTILVSRTAADAVAGKRELNLSLSPVPSLEPLFDETQRLDDSFVILEKGASFDTQAQIPVPFIPDDQKSASYAIRKGDHFLQIRVITWPESSSLAERLGAKWKRHGYLWHEVIQSEPMAFRIGQQVELEHCR